MPAAKQRAKPKLGTEFVKEYKNKTYKLRVVKDGYELAGITYTSPSTAAKTITKTEVNGWKFWKID